LDFELGRLCHHEWVEKTCFLEPPQQTNSNGAFSHRWFTEKDSWLSENR
jgi:hypothetical protein